MITEQDLRDLAAYRGEPAVTSLYLDVDGADRPRRSDYDAAFARLAEQVRSQTRGDARLAHAVDADLARMETWLSEGLDRATTRGIALFSCSDGGYFRAVTVPRAVHDQAAVDRVPHLGQLVALRDDHAPALVALVDRRRLRLLRFELGEASELPALGDPEPRNVDTSTELGSFARHRDEVARQHFRRAAAAVAAAFAERPVDHVVLSGGDEALAALERELPADVRGKVVVRTNLPVAAAPGEIAQTVRDLEETVERMREADAVEDLRQRAARGRGGVVGLDGTLSALGDQRVDTLFVSAGFSAPGARCPACGHLGADLHLCPRCHTPNVEIADVVEVAIAEAIAQGARVEICQATDLDRFGRIGAIERY